MTCQILRFFLQIAKYFPQSDRLWYWADFLDSYEEGFLIFFERLFVLFPEVLIYL
ncbi:hypothetical protein [Anabaena sp. CCY 9614]|uniref:hypothetical protein n=1 Tax=Anabaena sp. CCY 9614 TaxID=3103869 RepID=UPI0039C5C4E7